MGFLENPADTISAAATSELGIVALALIVLAGVTVAFFRKDNAKIRLIAWGVLVTAIVLFVLVVVFTPSANRNPASSNADSETPAQPDPVVPDVDVDTEAKDAPPPTLPCSQRALTRLRGSFVDIGKDTVCVQKVEFKGYGRFTQGCAGSQEVIEIRWLGQPVGRWQDAGFGTTALTVGGKLEVQAGEPGGRLELIRVVSNCSNPSGEEPGVEVTITYG